jgi:hypothetical protein
MKIFDNHYNKIDSYKNQIRSIYKEKIDIGFLIVDKFHNPVMYDNKFFSPVCVEKLLRFMSEREKVKFFIFYQKNGGNTPNLIFVIINKENIDFIIKNHEMVTSEYKFNVPKTKHSFISIKHELKISAEVSVSVGSRQNLKSK